MNDDTAPRWGRHDLHRVQHAWQPWPRDTTKDLYQVLCADRVLRVDPWDGRSVIDYGSDAARCERCAAWMKRREASA